MTFPDHQLPAQRQKEKDKREWTTTEQKDHLQSKQAEYGIARDQKTLQAWLSVELRTYFEKFPTGPVTVKENIDHPGWSHEEKRRFEETVSDSWLNGNYEKTYRWRANRESRHGLKTTVALQRKCRTEKEGPSNSNKDLKGSVTRSVFRSSITITTRGR
jgi:hypothetical protein